MADKNPEIALIFEMNRSEAGNDMDTSMINSIYSGGTYSTAATGSLENKLNNSDLTSATAEELMEVCKDFESYFLEQMLKSMVKMSKVDGDTDDSNMYASLFGATDTSDSGVSTMSSYFGDELVNKMAEQITEANGGSGLGLAQQLYEQMKRNYGISDAESDASVQKITK